MIPAKYTFVNVGAGDTFILQLGSKVVVLDAYRMDESHDNFIDYLPSKKIDLLILTHRHFDHYYGIDSLISNNIEVAEAWESCFIGHRDPSRYTMIQHWEMDSAPNCEALIERLAKTGTVVKHVSTQTPAVDFDGYTLTVLNPTADINNDFSNRPHDGCLVLMLRTPEGDKEILFCGDANISALDKVYKTQDTTNTKILCCSHHGGIDSMHVPLVWKTAPEYTVISSMPNIFEEIPEPEAVSLYTRYSKKGIRTTWGEGTFSIQNQSKD